MAVIHTWACFLLWVGFATQEKTPDVTVKCFVSEECVLPCHFQPGKNETVEWFKQDVLVYKFEHNSSDSSKYFKQKQLAEHASVSTQQISNGNATLTLRRSSLKDRGVYRCHVKTSNGENNEKVILKLEAPIKGLFLELSRLSGYEEIKCSVHNVFPTPRVTWVTEPPTYEALKPVTRVQADKMGLFSVDSRLRRLRGKPDLNYICKVTTSYGGPTWTASHKEREIGGAEGKDLTIPCRAPTYINNPSLYWTFSSGEEFVHILRYDSRSGRSVSPPPWDSHVEVDVYKVPFGDGSLSLLDPRPSEHSGIYTCEFSMKYSKHTEHNKVTIGDPNGDHDGEPNDSRKLTSKQSSYWWAIGVVIGVIVLTVGGTLAFLKLRGRKSKSKNDPAEETELNPVKDAAAH